MKANKKKILCSLLLVSCTLLSYVIWLSLRPVKIIATHQRSSNFSDILVNNFPFTDKGKITWWLENKDMIKSKYMVPNPGEDGSFYVTFWLFGDGYKKEGKYDRLCFDDMKKKENCIEKDAVFSVDRSKNMGTVFTVYDGTYLLQKDDSIVRVKSE